jgi:hypothetical protein
LLKIGYYSRWLEHYPPIALFEFDAVNQEQIVVDHPEGHGPGGVRDFPFVKFLGVIQVLKFKLNAILSNRKSTRTAFVWVTKYYFIFESVSVFKSVVFNRVFAATIQHPQVDGSFEGTVKFGSAAE